MTHHLRLFAARLLAMLAAFSLIAQPAAAQSILRDAETEALLQDLLDPLNVAAGLQPGQVDVVLINDSSINAFVAGGQRIYVHSGLIHAADTANEVQGVLAHELGHIQGGHVLRHSEGAGAAQTISILSLVLGVAAALAGSGDAAMGVIMAGQQAAIGKYLAFSRAQESTADAAGVDYLSKAGISGRGSVSFFKKLQSLEFRYGYSPTEEDAYARTHPLSGDRVATLQREYEEDPAWNKPDDPELQARFLRIKAKLQGYIAKSQDTLNAFPERRKDVPARYARAYAFHKDALIDKALAETDALLALDPKDPYFLELRGQILLESGRPAEALESLRQATSLSGHQPLIATTFGHALIATEQRANYAEAEQVLKTAVDRDRENPFAWYQLGVVYAARGDMARARLASAEQQAMFGQFAQALASAQAALGSLPTGSPDWLRAQDITMLARAELERSKERR